MNAERRRPALRGLACLLALAAGCGLMLFPATADEPAKPARAEAPPPTEVQSFKLKYTAAAEMARLLRELVGDKAGASSVRFVADVDANAILVSAPAGDLARIKDVIRMVDVPRPDQEAAPLELKVYELRAVEPDKALEDALRLVFRPGVSGNFALDKTRKLVIISADRRTAQAAEALLVRLEDLPTGRPAVDLQVRVVWLVNGGPQNTPPPPADLKEALPGLVRFGIDQPRVAAQTVVSITPNAEFRARGTAKLDTPCQFAVTGRLSDKKGPAALEISIRATQEGGRASTDLCNLETEISAPPGHLVVLGVTPTDGVSSAFVVQVLRREAAKQQPRR